MKLLKSKTTIFLMLFFSCAATTFSQTIRFSIEKYISSFGDTLLYRQLYPDSDTFRKYPLVIFLHGSGERGKDHEAQLKWGVMNFATDQTMKITSCLRYCSPMS